MPGTVSIFELWTTPHLQTSVRVCHTDLQDLLQEVDEYKLAHTDQVAVISVMTSPIYEGIPKLRTPSNMSTYACL